MISIEVKEQIQDILNLVSELRGTPVAVYQKDETNQVAEVTCSDKNHFPAFCHAMWAIKGGRERCLTNMCGRAGSAFSSNKPQTLSCHGSLLTDAAPITVENRTIAVMQYGAYIPDGADLSEHEAQLNQSLDGLNATEGERHELLRLLRDPKLIREKTELLEMRSKLPGHIAHLITSHLKKREKDRLVFHDLQMRLIALRAEASLLDNHLTKVGDLVTGNSLSQEVSKITSRSGNVVGAVESLGTTMHSLTGGEYLPRTYKFVQKNVLQFVQKAKRLIQAEAERRDIEIVVRIAPNAGQSVRASEAHMQEAFNNLFHNALKYSYHTPRGTQTKKRFILLEGKVVDESYKLWIQNYGVGIEKEEMELIFEEGYQGNLTQNERRGGAGQGLALTKRIVEAHKGTILAYSEIVDSRPEADGRIPYKTTFVVTLPLWHVNVLKTSHSHNRTR